MKVRFRHAAQALFIALLIAPAVSTAALVDRGGGLIYDTVLDVTWLSNANVNGVNNWNDSSNWAADFSYYDSVRNVTYTDWRLPFSLQPDSNCASQTDAGAPYGIQSSGHNCTGSEMGHLFSDLGGVWGQSIATAHNDNYYLFQNLEPHHYWTSEPYAPNPGNIWFFGWDDGDQSPDDRYGNLYAMLVRPGDVATLATPLPSAMWLFGSGLLGLVGMARARRSRI